LEFVICYLKFASLMTRPAIDARLMLPVTVQTPAHVQFDGPGNTRHCSHIAVAAGTDKSRAYMHHVREIDVVRHAVYPDPGDRLFFLPVLHQLFDFRSVLGDEQMAGPAVRHRGDAGNARLWSGAVTEETGDGVVASMILVAEGDRLDRGAVPEVQRQIVHERHSGKQSRSRHDQPVNEPR
jgi:hypothetical protein